MVWECKCFNVHAECQSCNLQKLELKQSVEENESLHKTIEGMWKIIVFSQMSGKKKAKKKVVLLINDEFCLCQWR